MRMLILCFLAFFALAPLSAASGGHVIPATKAKAMVEAYQLKAKATTPSATAEAAAAAAVKLLSVAFPKEAIQQLLKQKGLAKVRVYNALNDAGEETIVILGVDATGADQTAPGQMGVDNGEPCPPRCPPGTGGGGGDD